MPSNLEIRFAKLFFTQSARARIYKKLNRFLTNTITLPKALDILWDHASDDGKKPKDSQAIIIDQWRRQVAEGRRLGHAMKGWVPEADRLIIEGGEEAGELPLAIEKAMSISASSGKIKTTIIKGLAYPAFIMCGAVGLLILILKQVIPAFDSILPSEQWTGIGAQMAVVASLVDSFLILFLALAIGITTATVWSLPRWTGNLRVKFDRFPPWSLYRLVLGSGFLLTLGGMLRAGISQNAALDMLRRDASPWYRERITAASKWLNEGFNLGEALQKAGHNFPDKESVKDLRAFAELKKFDEELEKLGAEWLEESVAKVESQTGVLRNLSFVVLAGVLIWIYYGIYSLQHQIAQALN